MLEVGLWIVFGLISGWIWSLVVRTGHDEPHIMKYAVAGAIGALSSGIGARVVSETGMTGITFMGVIVAIFGAILAIALFKIFRRTVRTIYRSSRKTSKQRRLVYAKKIIRRSI